MKVYSCLLCSMCFSTLVTFVLSVWKFGVGGGWGGNDGCWAKVSAADECAFSGYFSRFVGLLLSMSILCF